MAATGVMPECYIASEAKTSVVERVNQDSHFATNLCDIHPLKLKVIGDFFAQCLRALDLTLWSIPNFIPDEDKTDGGTTVSAVILLPPDSEGETQYIRIHAGDSPIYFINAAGVQLLNNKEFHSASLDAPRVPKEFIAKHGDDAPYRLVTLSMYSCIADFWLRSVGHRCAVCVEEGTVSGEGVFAVCSDGASDYLTNEKIFEACIEAKTIEHYPRHIINKIKEIHGSLPDDTTATMHNIYELSAPTLFGVADGHGQYGEAFAKIVTAFVEGVFPYTLEIFLEKMKFSEKAMAEYLKKFFGDLNEALIDLYPKDSERTKHVMSTLENNGFASNLEENLLAALHNTLELRILREQMMAFGGEYLKEGILDRFEAAVGDLDLNTENEVIAAAKRMLESLTSFEEPVKARILANFATQFESEKKVARLVFAGVVMVPAKVVPAPAACGGAGCVAAAAPAPA